MDYGYYIDGYDYDDDGYAIPNDNFPRLPVNVTDTDTNICGVPGINVVHDDWIVPEDGSITYDVTLNTQPKADVTITITVDGDDDEDGIEDVKVTVNETETELTFTPVNWETAQSVAVMANDDPDGVDDKVTITHTAVSTGDGDYNGLKSTVIVTVVDDENNSPTGLPTITGTRQVGQRLTADVSGIKDADGLANVVYTYQWFRNGSNDPISTGRTYTLQPADEGKSIRVKVFFTDDDTNDEMLTSDPTENITRRLSPNTSTPTATPPLQPAPLVEAAEAAEAVAEAEVAQ